VARAHRNVGGEGGGFGEGGGGGARGWGAHGTRSGKGLALEAQCVSSDNKQQARYGSRPASRDPRAPPVADRPVEGQFTLASAPVRTVLAGAPQASAPVRALHWLLQCLNWPMILDLGALADTRLASDWFKYYRQWPVNEP
jgi:hypothetical protein